MESTLVPVLLKELLLSFGFLIPELVGAFHVLPQPLFLRQCSSSFDFFALFFSCNLVLFLFLDPRKFSQPPCLEFASRVKTVRIINIRNFIFFLFYKPVSISLESRKMTRTLCQFTPYALRNHGMALLSPLLHFFFPFPYCFFCILSNRLAFRHCDTGTPAIS